MKWFIDTNVFICLKTDQDTEKRRRCEAWLSAILQHGTPVISPQVINESVTQMLRRALHDGDRAAAVMLARELLPWCEARIDGDTERAAIDLYERHRLSWWDSVLVSSAAQARAKYLLTEDMQDGRKIVGLEIINPFGRAPEHFVPSTRRR